MSKEVVIRLEMPDDLPILKLPKTVDQRLQSLLDRQDQGEALTSAERQEAECIVDLAEFLSLLRLKADPGQPGK